MMKNRISRRACYSIISVFLFTQAALANDRADIPDINGEWISLAENGDETNAMFAIIQDGKHLEGMFTDSKDGQLVVEAPIAGYIDREGNVIFDIYFGRIKSTNRLKLSSDRNILQGTFTNNTGNEGNVHLRRK
jgi:hypothetical protein